jgi:hypothetical protein
MLFKKITHGYVTQIFNDTGQCIAQKFDAGDDVEYEIIEEIDDNGLPINVEQMPYHGDEYHPYDMKQPPHNLMIH